MATMTNDKQRELQQLVQMATGNRLGIRIENMSRNGMSATNVICEVIRGGGVQRAVSPNRCASQQPQ